MHDPQPLVPRNAEPESLDARIALAEQRLIAREERLQRGLIAAGQHLRSALRPRRLLPLLLGAGLAFGLLVWLLRRSGTAVAAARSRPAAGNFSRDAAAAPWLGALTFVWPWLPASWRTRVSPATANALLLLVLGPIRRLFGRALAAPLPGLPCADLRPGSGRWYEIARLPASADGCRGPMVVECRLQTDGSLAVTRHCAGPRGELAMHGELRRVAGKQGGSRLEISFLPAWLRWWPAGWTGYRLLHLDVDQGEALIGNTDRRLLCLLARRPTLAPERARALQQVARDCGFAAERLRWAEVRAIS